MTRNEQLHTRFMSYYEKALRPNLTIVCKEMAVPYTSFLKWKNEQLFYTDMNLNKIEGFLNDRQR